MWTFFRCRKKKCWVPFPFCDYAIVQTKWKWNKGKTGLIPVMVFSAVRRVTIRLGRMRRYFTCVLEAFRCSLNINRQRWPSSLLLNHQGRTEDQYMTTLIINKCCSAEIMISLYLYFTSGYIMKTVGSGCAKICPIGNLIMWGLGSQIVKDISVEVYLSFN